MTPTRTDSCVRNAVYLYTPWSRKCHIWFDCCIGVYMHLYVPNTVLQNHSAEDDNKIIDACHPWWQICLLYICYYVNMLLVRKINPPYCSCTKNDPQYFHNICCFLLINSFVFGSSAWRFKMILTLLGTGAGGFPGEWRVGMTGAARGVWAGVLGSLLLISPAEADADPDAAPFPPTVRLGCWRNPGRKRQHVCVWEKSETWMKRQQQDPPCLMMAIMEVPHYVLPICTGHRTNYWSFMRTLHEL